MNSNWSSFQNAIKLIYLDSTVNESMVDNECNVYNFGFIKIFPKNSVLHNS